MAGAGQFGIKIVLQGGIGGVTRDLNSQLAGVILKPLNIKVNIDNVSIDKATKSNSSLTSSSKQTQQQMSNFEKILNQTTESYKKQTMGIEDYISKLNTIRSMSAFKQLSDEKQIKTINSLTQAEAKLAGVQSTTRKVANIQNQSIASNIGKLIGGDISSRGTDLSNIKKIESEQVSSINRVRQAALNSENISFNNIRLHQKQIDIENQSIASNIGKLIGGDISSRGNVLAGIPKPIDVDKTTDSIKRLQNSMAKMTTGSSKGFLNPSEVEIVNSRIKTLSENFTTMARPTVASEIRAIRTEMQGLNGVAQNAARSSLNLGDALYQAAIKFPLWMAVSTIFMQTFNAIRDGVKYIYELDNSLNEIRIVTYQTSAEVAKLALSYNALGQAMGVSTKEIADTAVDLYRQGLALDAVNERMLGIIKYAKIAGIELGEANKIITATMNNLGVSAQETIDVMSYMGKILPPNIVMCW